MYYVLTYIKKGTPRSIPPASLMNMINPINYGVLIVVHMEYKLQLYKVSSKWDEEYESFLDYIVHFLDAWMINFWMYSY